MSEVENQAESDLIDSLVEEFESTWQPLQIEKIKELVANKGCNSGALVSELIRVDLELNWRNGHRVRVEDYQVIFPELDQDSLTAIAFEEYRCRIANGDSAVQSEYSQRLGIDTSTWPTWDRPPNRGEDFPGVGDTILSFEILGILGTGAVGQVYLAKQKDLASRLVVIKVTREQNTEADSLAQLQHTNIVPIYSLHRTDSFQVICMPFLGIITLRDVIRLLASEGTPDGSTAFISTVAKMRLETVVESVDTERLNDLGRRKDLESTSICDNQDLNNQSFQKTAVWLIEHVARGLSYAHANGIMHGDVKPENILLQNNAEPLLLDFHLASERKHETSGPDGGTLPYMAPEHLLSLVNQGETDERSDIYSAGLVLYELLTGTILFQGSENPDDLFVSQRVDHQKNISIQDDPRLSGVSPDLKSIIAKCLEFDRKQRYQFADELAVDLNRHSQDLPLACAPNRSLIERSRKWYRRNKWVTSVTTIITLLTIMTIVAGIIGWSHFDRSRRLENISQSNKFLEELKQANLLLSSIDHREIDIDSDIEFAESVLRDYEADSLTSLEKNSRFRAIPQEQKDIEIQTLSKAGYWLADAYLRKSIAKPDNAVELLEKAKAYNQMARDLADGERTGLSIQLKAIDNVGSGQVSKADVGQFDVEKVALSELIEIANAAYSLGEIEDAIRATERYLEYEPSNYAAWLMKGNYLVAQKKLDAAEAWLYPICCTTRSERVLV